MNWYCSDDIYVSPAALISFAWSAPMRDLAAKIGISDVGLKKLLRSHGIVTPPQGHWNKVHAGKRVMSPPKAPPRRPGETGRIRLDRRFKGLVDEVPAIAVDGPFASQAVPEDLGDLRAQELKAIGRVAVPKNLDKPHPGLAKLLKREEQRREKLRLSNWHWDSPMFDTPLAQRQLKILNALFFALEKQNWTGSVSERDRALDGSCMIGHRQLGMSFAIIGKHRTEMISGYQRPASDLPASTPIRLSLSRQLRTQIKTSWQDDEAGKLEIKIADIAADLIVAAEASFRQSLIEEQEHQAQMRKWEEERRLQRLAELEAQRLEDLKTSGTLLARAEEIRALIASVKSAVSAGKTSMVPADLAKWERWASAYADRIDPVLSGQVLSHINVPELD